MYTGFYGQYISYSATGVDKRSMLAIFVAFGLKRLYFVLVKNNGDVYGLKLLKVLH